MEDYRVKNYEFLDSKPYFASWEIDVFIVFVTFFGLAFLTPTGSFLPFVILSVIGLIAAYSYSKIKHSKVKGYFFHILYSLGILKTKTLPPSYMRVFFGA